MCCAFRKQYDLDISSVTNDLELDFSHIIFFGNLKLDVLWNFSYDRDRVSAKTSLSEYRVEESFLVTDGWSLSLLGLTHELLSTRLWAHFSY